MTGRDLIQKILDTKVTGYESEVIIRTPECSSYKNFDIYVADYVEGYPIVIDIIDDQITPAGSDFDLDKGDNCGHPVEDDINLALDVTVARQNVQIYNHTMYPQIKEIDRIITTLSKQGIDYYELVLDENSVYLDNNK